MHFRVRWCDLLGLSSNHLMAAFSGAMCLRNVRGLDLPARHDKRGAVQPVDKIHLPLERYNIDSKQIGNQDPQSDTDEN